MENEELFNLLINPLSHNFALRWHRDDVKENATQEEEIAALGVWHHGVRSCRINECACGKHLLFSYQGTMEYVS